MLEAVIFDMDGLLIDSEPLWRQAEMELFQFLGVPITEDMCFQTLGLRVGAVVDHWYSRFPWVGLTKVEVENELVRRAETKLKEKSELKPGVLKTIRLLESKGFPLAVCSSSPLGIIEAALAKSDIRKYFKVIHSAERETYGKPHPAAYINTALQLRVLAKNVLVFEDSLTGAIAAKAAEMKVIAIPEEYYLGTTKLDFCDLVLPNLELFKLEDALPLFS